MSCIVTRDKGADAPDAYFELALKHNKGNFGVAFAEKGDFVCIGDSDSIGLQNIRTINKEHKDKQTVYFFDDVVRKLKIDAQPFILIRDAKDRPLLVCFITNCEAYKKPESTHSGEFFCFDDHIRPSVQKAFKLVKTLEATMDYLNGDDFQTEIDAIMSRAEGASIMFVSALGIEEEGQTPLRFNYNESADDFSWGTTTDAYGFKEAKVEEPEEPVKEDEGEEGERTGLGDILGDTGDTKETKPADTPKTQVLNGITVPDPLPRGMTFVEGVLYYKCPKLDDNGMERSHQDVRENYKIWAGYINKPPESFKNFPNVKVMKGITTLPIVSKTSQGPDLTAAAKNALKDTTSHLSVAATNAPGFISVETKKIIEDAMLNNEHLKNMLDHEGKKVDDPTKIQLLEKRPILALKVMGLTDITSTFFTPEEAFMEIAKNPDWSASFMMEMQNYLRSWYPIVQAAATKSVVVPATTKPTATTERTSSKSSRRAL